MIQTGEHIRLSTGHLEPLTMSRLLHIEVNRFISLFKRLSCLERILVRLEQRYVREFPTSTLD